MSFANSRLAYIVIWGQVVAFLVLVVSLCLTMFYKNYSDPVVLVALISLSSSLAGNLGSILGGPRSMMPPTNGATPVTITQPDNQPVPVTETPKP